VAKRTRTKTFDLTWFGDDYAAAVESGTEPGLWALGNLVLDEAQRRAPKRTGRLERSGYVATTARSSYARQTRDRARLPRPKAQQVLVAFAAFYAKILEGGATTAHAIPGTGRRSVRGASKVLKIPGIGYRAAVMHPGAKRRAFLGPALESVKQQGTEVLVQEIRKQIERELPRAG